MRILPPLAALLVLAAACAKPAPRPTPPASATTTAPTTPAVSRAERTAGAPVAATSLVDVESYADYAILLPPGTDPGPVFAALEDSARRRGFAFGPPPDGEPVGRRVQAAVAPPADLGITRDALVYLGRGLSDADLAALAEVDLAVIFGIGGPADDAAEIQRAGADLAREAAAVAQGWIHDGVTIQTFTRAAFDDLRPPGFALDVLKLVVVHTVPGDGTLLFFETRGLTRFGLPELYLDGVPQSFADDVLMLVNAAAQTLVENGAVTRDGALDVSLGALDPPWWKQLAAAAKASGGGGTVTWTATWSRGDHDGETPDLIELTLPGAGETAQRLLAALATTFGPYEERTVDAADDDPELAAARKAAMAELAALAPRFADGVPAMEKLLVKAPFANAQGQIEWMWVEVQTWKGDRLTGILVNEPNDIAGLHAGATVEVKQGELFDYLH